MADIELVIKIPEELAEKGHWYTDEEIWAVVRSVQNGTPIPDNATNHDAMMKYAYSYGKKDVLEQIRDEIEQNIPLNDGIEGYNTGYAQGIQKALQIIDKYKGDNK